MRNIPGVLFIAYLMYTAFKYDSYIPVLLAGILAIDFIPMKRKIA